MLFTQKPVLELPAALVEELLEKNEKVGSELLRTIEDIQEHKKDIRQWLDSEDLVRTDSESEEVQIPTTCGIDGSYVQEHMLSTSVVACAAVAIEGFTPPALSTFLPENHR